MTEPSREPIDDAERIRLKRLAKLSQPPSASQSPPILTPTPTPPPPPSTSRIPPKLVEKRLVDQPAQESTRPKKKLPLSDTPQRLNFDTWQNIVLTKILKVTLDKQKAEESGHDLVWLKKLQVELQEEGYNLAHSLTFDILDRLLIARLSIDPNSGSEEDLEYLAVLASLPAEQTVLQYLTGCWRRLNSVKNDLTAKNKYVQEDVNNALPKLEDLRMLLMSYIGLTMQEPESFPQPTGKACGSPELLESLFNLSMSAFAGGFGSLLLLPGELRDFFNDLANRWVEDNLEDIISPLMYLLCFHPSLKREEGLGGTENIWRWIITSLELLVSIKPIAIAITRIESWCPSDVTGDRFELASLMGPLLRLGVFNRQWPYIASTYFSDPLKRTRQDVDSSNATLRLTLQNLQSSIFQIFNNIVRASSESREAVLAYFATAANLNVKRGGLQVDFDTVASDTFMINIHAILLRFAEPFMDSSYSKMDRIDTEYYRHSSRLNVKDETRLKATTEEVAKWVEGASSSTSSPNFITEVFYLTMAFNHYGLVRTIQVYDEIRKQLDNMQRHLDTVNADTTWFNTPLQARVEAQIAALKNEMAKLHQTLFAYQVQLADADYTQRNITFTTFLTIWLIRFVDPRKTHPVPYIKLPLPQDIPVGFRMLPEFFIEDVVDYYLYLVTHQPHTLQVSGKIELVDFALTFLSSTWYITNPYLKSKLVQILFYGTLPYGHETFGLLGGVLNSHPLALEHLISCLVSFYIEAESTGTNTQFYDKFETRRQIAHIWKLIWTNHVHRDALRNQANDLDKFVRFVNLMMNDVTYLLDEALSKLAEIYGIQTEMEDAEAWATKPLDHRRERERTLHQLEGSATTYTALGKSTVALLKEFTAEIKQPFMTPEIVDRLAAMLTYNLDALVGPRCQDLKVKNPEKYRFNPRQLLSDILQVFLNLSDQEPFIKAVAGEGRSYKKELFERAAGIARRRFLKEDEEIEQLRLFVVKVEETKVTLEDEEVEDVPDEFLDPLMFTIMRDPVTLPTSKVVVDRSTIKAHLLSDANDPFNRAPLKLEDVITNPDMKAKIEAFIAARRSKKQAEITVTVPSADAMEVDHLTL